MTAKQKQCMLCYMDCLEEAEIDGLWGPGSMAATRVMQEKLGIPADGIWGDQTDAAIRAFISSGQQLAEATNKDAAEKGQTGTFWDHIRYWTREEFKCQCGNYHAPYCDGFPAEPDQTLVELLDDIRAHFGRVAHRSSGLRCKQHNADQPGSVPNSKHMYGKAMDFFIEGISGEAVRAYAAADPRCAYAYVIEGSYVHVEVR